ncbi:response regulator [Dyadobacter psychrotolerans]|uniref:Response regulator transcription factor n=1 Tax=Dyadobacter psychrotolerans TaxID=2541721 RepID=A0A4R5DLC2_9BACT|nr:response regulator transcription factor [Dyadobacter psychrotolerans]TDE12824.1 response regulator transcription factor [Dyadobacter psychrotolerans]
MPVTDPIRVILVDDHHLFSDGLNAMLSNYPVIEVVEQIFHSPDVLSKVHNLNPDVILLDFNMPRMNGMQVAERLLSGNSKYKILMLSMYNELRLIEEFRKIGVMGYLLKTATVKEVVEAIETISKGIPWYPADLVPKTGNNHSDDYFLKTFKLTGRELNIIRLIREGLSSQEISESLSISLFTVETHRKNISTKLNLKGRNELLRFAIENDL